MIVADFMDSSNTECDDEEVYQVSVRRLKTVARIEILEGTGNGEKLTLEVNYTPT